MRSVLISTLDLGMRRRGAGVRRIARGPNSSIGRAHLRVNCSTGDATGSRSVAIATALPEGLTAGTSGVAVVGAGAETLLALVVLGQRELHQGGDDEEDDVDDRDGEDGLNELLVSSS